MSDPSKRNSNIFQESLLMVKGQKNNNKAQTVADLSDLNRTITIIGTGQTIHTFS